MQTDCVHIYSNVKVGPSRRKPIRPQAGDDSMHLNSPKVGASNPARPNKIDQ